MREKKKKKKEREKSVYDTFDCYFLIGSDNWWRQMLNYGSFVGAWGMGCTNLLLRYGLHINMYTYLSYTLWYGAFKMRIDIQKLTMRKKK